MCPMTVTAAPPTNTVSRDELSVSPKNYNNPQVMLAEIRDHLAQPDLYYNSLYAEDDVRWLLAHLTAKRNLSIRVIIGSALFILITSLMYILASSTDLLFAYLTGVIPAVCVMWGLIYAQEVPTHDR
jgi:hypothetical protein